MSNQIINRYENVECKICNSKTYIYGVCDFNKNCEGTKIGNKMPMIGHAVYYHKCNSCGFIFSIDFDNWTKDDFIRNIYNDEYEIVDPEYKEIRPKNLVQWMLPLLNGNTSITMLDYGAGTAVFGKTLNQLGYQCESWDPMWGTPPSFSKDKKFDVITAFEVIEHTPTPIETIQEMISFLEPGSGQIVMHSLANDIITNEGIGYWYIAPRNGHVCMFSHRSIDVLFDKFGMRVDHLAANTHVASWKN